MEFSDPGAALDVSVHAAGSATRDWVYILDGWLVPDAPRVFDFLSNLTSASWSSAAGALTVNGPGSDRGEVSSRTSRTLHNEVRYYGRTVFTHPDWNPTGFVRGVYSGVAVPAEGALIRGALGWARGRRVTSNGVEITVRWRPTGDSDWQTLVDQAQYDLNNETGPKNDLMYLEIPLPSAAEGTDADFLFQVDTDGESAQDWVTWVKLALTSA